MKARTKAARRRGRPRLPATDRQPNGQKSRRLASIEDFNEAEKQANMNVALDARIRHFGIVGKNATAVAGNPRFGSALGLLFMSGHITPDQFEAGERFCEDMGRHYSLNSPSSPNAKAQNLFAVAGEAGESDSRAEAAARASAKAKKLQGLLLGDKRYTNISVPMQEGRDTLRIVQMVAVQDQHIGRSTRALFLLRRGLNVLHRHYQG